MQSLKVALDWTPNTNHTAILLAQHLGEYESLGLSVELIDPSVDGYATTPAARLVLSDSDPNHANIAITPSESILAYRFSDHPAHLRAIAAILQRDASAIAVLSSSTIHRPRDLDGKRYASYGARFEDDIVRAMIRADGGRGDIEVVKPPKLGIWETLLKGEADATWIFQNWEGCEAQLKGLELRRFTMGEAGIPYGYSPLLVVNEDNKPNDEILKRFLSATRKGHTAAVSNPQWAADIVQNFVPKETDTNLVARSLRWMIDQQVFVDDDEQWGSMSLNTWSSWVGWLRVQKLLKKRDGTDVEVFEVGGLFTNEFLEA